VTAEGFDEAVVDADGEEAAAEVLAELAALAAAEAEAEVSATAELEGLRRELEAERERTRAAVARYRTALLAAEPELPAELVVGETLDALDSAVASARRAVAQIRERLEAEGARGFPMGAPPRGTAAGALTASEKIAAGLAQRERRG
jgi:hypothetical protein